MSKDFKPSELKGFLNVFERVAIRHQYSQVLEDFLTMAINWFGNGLFVDERDQAMSKYSKEEKKLFNQMFTEMVKALEYIHVKDGQTDNTGCAGDGWYDFFGGVYEWITGTGKKSGLGQFFTPSTLVDVMVALVDIPEDGKDLLISDPCCGSGRMIIASHAKNPKNFHFATDIDLICCKMTVVNMFVHGCQGEVVWMDALSSDDWRKGWLIKREVFTGFPCIFPLEKEQSYLGKMGSQSVEKEQVNENLFDGTQEDMPETVIVGPQQKVKVKKKSDVDVDQLKLFE